MYDAPNAVDELKQPRNGHTRSLSESIESRLEYFNTLEAYAVEGNLALFSDTVAKLTEQQIDRCIGMIE